MFLRRSIGLGLALSLVTAGNASAQDTPPSAPGSQAAPQNVLTKAPELLQFVEAVRPPGTEALEGVVVLMLTLQADGRVSDVVVESAAGQGFDEAAVAAARQFVFSPAEVDGQPAAVQLAYRYNFTVKTQEIVVASDAPVGAVQGVLVERGTRAPLVGVTVRIETPPLEAVTDAEGRFEFLGVPAGKVKLVVDEASYYKIEDLETVEAGKATAVKYYVERTTSPLEGVIVVGRRIKKEVSQKTLTLTEIRKIPGTSGDALKVVQNLPGVARAPFGAGLLVIRGSNPDSSGATINRHFIPLAFHFGGLRSTFSSALLESIDLYPGNFGAEFGRFSGGIVDARVRRPKTDRLHGFFEADFFDAGVLVEGPVGENGAFAVAGRRSYIDFLLPVFLPDDANLDFVVAPRYYDYQTIYDWKKGRHQLKLFLFGSDDELSFLLDQPAGDPAVRGNFKNKTTFYRGYANWIYKVTDDVTQDLSVSVGKNELFFAGADRFYFDNDIWAITVREDIEVKMGERLKLRTGVDIESFIAQINITAPQPPKEGDDQGAGTPLSVDRLITAKRQAVFVNPGVWLELQARVTDDLLVVPAARIDYDYKIDDLTVDPRLTARWQVVDGTTLKGGVGAYMQRPGFDESDPDFGDPTIKSERTIHTTVGVEQRIDEGLTLDTSLFYKNMYEQVVRAPTDTTIQGLQANTDAQGIDYENIGKGRVYGLEVLLRRELSNRFFGWISYTLSRSERKDSPQEAWRVFDFDQTHILTALAQYKITSAWEIGARWRYVTGNPETPFKGAVYDSNTDTYTPIPDGGTNDARLPAFHQFDLRVDRNWIFDLWVLTAYLEIQNAYNRSNPEGYTYNYDYTEKKLLSGLPIIPSFGLRGEF
ncbi:MAG: TonB family protein [Bradymonadia bacterium]|jgi:TonB family protein